MPLLIAALLGLSGLVIVIYPLLGLDRDSRDAAETLAGGPIADVVERERSARDALREVEFDHRLGNLDDTDYQALRARYERRALSALKARYQREQELDALIEQQLDALRRQGSAEMSADGEETSSSSTQIGRAGNVVDSSAALASQNARSATQRTGARPARGPQARRRRGGRA